MHVGAQTPTSLNPENNDGKDPEIANNPWVTVERRSRSKGHKKVANGLAKVSWHPSIRDKKASDDSLETGGTKERLASKANHAQRKRAKQSDEKTKVKGVHNSGRIRQKGRSS